MEWVETTGRTIEEALDTALDELGVDENDVEYEVLARPRGRLFGRTGAGAGRGGRSTAGSGGKPGAGRGPRPDPGLPTEPPEEPPTQPGEDLVLDVVLVDPQLVERCVKRLFDRPAGRLDPFHLPLPLLVAAPPATPPA